MSILLLTALTSGCASLRMNWIPASQIPIKYPVFISGVHTHGSDVTEPRLVRGKYLKVNSAGILLIPEGAGFFVNAELISKATSNLYFKIEYPNPAESGHPLVQEAHYQEGVREYKFGSPDIIWSLEGYRNYTIKISLYENEDASQPLEVLRQKVRSYVSTLGGKVLIYGDAAEVIPRV